MSDIARPHTIEGDGRMFIADRVHFPADGTIVVDRDECRLTFDPEYVTTTNVYEARPGYEMRVGIMGYHGRHGSPTLTLTREQAVAVCRALNGRVPEWLEDSDE